MNCTSCGIKIETQKNWVQFDCPSCRKAEIIRCERCRRLVNTYECPSCKFIGP
ncbi:MAG: zinc finger domain-containing protein [Candidatus Aenigmarchaeota archaeon]